MRFVLILVPPFSIYSVYLRVIVPVVRIAGTVNCCSVAVPADGISFTVTESPGAMLIAEFPTATI